MRRRPFITILCAGVLAATVIALVWPREREPEYKGKKLSEWIILSYQSRVPPETRPIDQARDAVQQIGTNAIPFLLQWIRYEPTAWRRKILSYRDMGWDNFLIRILLRDSRDERAGRGQRGLELLGTNAIIALPDLAKSISDQTAPYTAKRAARAMGYIGKDALPPLLTEATNHNNAQRFTIILTLGYLGYLGTNALPAVPVLIDCLQDTNYLIRMVAARSLGGLQLQPEIVLPALARLASTNALENSRAIPLCLLSSRH